MTAKYWLNFNRAFGLASRATLPRIRSVYSTDGVVHPRQHHKAYVATAAPPPHSVRAHISCAQVARARRIILCSPSAKWPCNARWVPKKSYSTSLLLFIRVVHSSSRISRRLWQCAGGKPFPFSFCALVSAIITNTIGFSWPSSTRRRLRKRMPRLQQRQS